VPKSVDNQYFQAFLIIIDFSHHYFF